MIKNFIILGGILFGGLLISLTSYGQDKPVVVVDRDTESSDEKTQTNSGESASDVKAGVAQGLSLREAMTLNQQSAWSYSATTATFRSLDYYDESYWSIGADVSYRLKPGQSLTAQLSYFETVDRYDEDPERLGVSDLGVSWLLPNFWSNPKYGMLSASMTVTAPTSELSQRESLIGSVSSDLTYRKPLTGALRFLTLSTSASLILSHYTFETSNAFGTDTNAPLAVAVGFAGTVRFGQSIFWTNSYSLYNRMDYDSDWRTIQTLASSVAYLITPKARLFGQYRWRDEVVTNDSFLDDDKSRFTLGGSYFF